MVRLKGNTLYKSFRPYFISIPYGSIKRDIPKIDVIDIDRFQFLMVRLKAGKLASRETHFPDFNSLWFD